MRAVLGAVASLALHAALLAVALVALPPPPAKRAQPRVAFDVEDAAAPAPARAPAPAPAAPAPPVKHAAPRREPAKVAAPKEVPISIEEGDAAQRPAPIASPASAPPVPAGSGGEAQAAPPDPNAIRSAIAQSIRYPRLARSQGLEGQVTVRFRIDAAGTPNEITIVTSAGELLDSAARDAVTRAAPYRSPPGWVRVPVIFSLHDAR